MNLKTRVVELERLAFPSNNTPIFVVAMDRGDQTQPYFIEHDGERWTQGPSEPFEVFKDRAIEGARLHPPPRANFPALYLCALRPSLTQEQWTAKYGPGSPYTGGKA